MVKILTTYEGSLRCRAVHAPSDTALATDAPVDNEGLGQSYSPTDLVATALATCAVTTMAIVAKREDIPFSEAAATVEKGMVADPVRRIGSLNLAITCGDALTAEQRERLEHAGRNCPVAKSLHPDVATPLTFTWS